MTETKPEGLSRDESWAWDNTAPGSWQRRAIAWAHGRNTDREGTAKDARRDYPLYLRFGDLPEGGRSTTGRREWIADGLGWFRGRDLEDGVSVFRAARSGSAYVVDVSAAWELAACFDLLVRSGRPAYLATGREAGVGASGEPVLEGVALEPLPEGAEIIGTGHHARSAAVGKAALRVAEAFSKTGASWA